MRRVQSPVLAILVVLGCAAVPWAADEDRVGFPHQFKEEFARYHTFNKDRKGKPSLKELWINPVGAKAREGEPFPYGTVIVMATYSVQGQDGSPAKDEKGLYVPEELTRIDVMRKERGYGESYGAKRSGEWEYATYEPGGTLKKGDAAACAACHLEKAAKTDFVFTADRILALPIP